MNYRVWEISDKLEPFNAGLGAIIGILLGRIPFIGYYY
jgi:hypothetical protein